MTRTLRFLLGGAAAAAALAGAGLRDAVAVDAATPRRDDPFAPFVEPSFPFIVTTLDAGKLGPKFPTRNLAVRCVVLALGDSTHACFDTDLLRLAVAWHGGHTTMTTMAQVSYQEAGNKNNQIPRPIGRPIAATGVYPGWMVGDPVFRDPRPAGPDTMAVGRGPLAASVARWNGIRLVGNDAVLSYTVGGTDIEERFGTIASAGHRGISRLFRVGPVARPLTLVVAEVPEGSAAETSADGRGVVVYEGAGRDTVTAVGAGAEGARLQVEANRYITLRLPAGMRASTFPVLVWRGPSAGREVVAGERARYGWVESSGPSEPRWGSVVTTRGRVAPDTADYVTDRLTLPIPNPWRRNVRVGDVDFFSDGRAAVVTFEGDVWIVSGIAQRLDSLQWRRFASGLYEPLNVAVVRDTVYVYDRQGIVRLVDQNGDGEADRYENFSNLMAQSGESREFPLGMAVKPEGGFYLAIGGALDLGPKTSPAIMTGFRAGSSQSGTVQLVSADGRSIRTFASGLREPIIGIDPRTGTVAASDQQGNFVPSTPIFLLKDGGYYGVPATAHRENPPAPEPPLMWIPHSVDQSGAGEVWVPGDRMGFGAENVLVHLSYGRPGPFRVYVDSTRSGVQGALVALPGEYRAPTLKGRVNPRDGQLYLAGFSVWGSKATEVSSLLRLRYTGRPSTLPTGVESGVQGVLVRFSQRIDPATAGDPARYTVKRWNYVRSASYGSGHFKLDGTPGQETMPLAAHLSPDGRSVLLVVPDMKPVMQMSVDYDLRSRAGRALRSSLYLTVHAVDTLDLRAAGFGALDWRASMRRAAAKPATVAAAPARAATAAQGEAAYRKYGCVGCHSVDGTTAGKTGPTFKGLFGAQRPLVGKPARVANEAYLRHAILDPASEIVQGFEPGMPSFRGVLKDAEIESVILYIKSLGARR